MDFGFTEEEMELIRNVRQFIQEESSPELVKESLEAEYIPGHELANQFFRKFGAKGWLTPSWPRKYGGLESSEMVTYIIRNELAMAGLPYHHAGANMVGPFLLRYGSDELKDEFLIRIAKGEIEFCIGLSEPCAGSDIASLETMAECKKDDIRAEDMGDDYLINGQKVFNTHAHIAKYHWVAVRTDPDAPKHKGISTFIVDLDSPGITIRPLITMAGTRTNEVFYDNVKVPRNRLVGELNRGFSDIMTVLNFERMFPFGYYKHLLEKLVDYAKDTIIDGKLIAKDPIVRQKLAQLAIEAEVVELLYYQLASMLESGAVPSYESSMEKVFLCEFSQRLTRTAMEIMGPRAQVRTGDPWAVMDGVVEHFYRFCVVETIVSGTSEIQRNIIAQRGLGL